MSGQRVDFEGNVCNRIVYETNVARRVGRIDAEADDPAGIVDAVAAAVQLAAGHRQLGHCAVMPQQRDGARAERGGLAGADHIAQIVQPVPGAVILARDVRQLHQAIILQLGERHGRVAERTAGAGSGHGHAEPQ